MRKFIKNRLKNERGLTLVELLAVIVILAIVGAIAFVMIGNIIDNSRKDAHVANAMQLIDAAKLYEANGGVIGDGNGDNSGVTAKQLQGEDTINDETHELLGELIDPWTKEPYSTDGKVTKEKADESGDDNRIVYKVILKADGNNCAINGKSEAELIKDGREVCEGE